MKHSKFLAVIVVSVMMFSVVQPVIAEAQTGKEWGRDLKKSAEETPSSMTGAIDDVLRLAQWGVGATVEYFADDEPEEDPQEEQKSSWWWPF